MASIPAVVANHPTTAAGGVSGALTTIILSGLLHMNIHPTIEETVAWNTVLTAFLGWLLRFMSKRLPVLDVSPPESPPSEPLDVQPATGG